MFWVGRDQAITRRALSSSAAKCMLVNQAACQQECPLVPRGQSGYLALALKESLLADRLKEQWFSAFAAYQSHKGNCLKS